MPRAQAVAIFDHAGDLFDVAEAAQAGPLRALALDLLAAPGSLGVSAQMRRVGEVAHYGYLASAASGRPLAVMTFSVDPPFPADQPEPAEALAGRLAPLLLLLARDLGRTHAHAQMQWTLEALRTGEQPASGADPIDQLLQLILAKLEADLIVVNTPEFQFEQMATGPHRRLVDVQPFRDIAAGKLLALARTPGETLCVNKARTSQGGERFRLASVPLRHANASPGVLAVFTRYDRRRLAREDVRLLERIGSRIVELIEHRIDPATGLPTRIALEHYAQSADPAATATPRCVVYVDVDQMHVINELFGFETGDQVLRVIAQAWPGGRIPEGGMIGRLSGDRFAAVLDLCTLNQARAWAEAARRRIEVLELDPPGRGFKLSASFGVAVLAPEMRFEAAIALAATACRAAKDRGRNRVEIFSDDDKSLMQRQDDMHSFRRLLAALERRQVRLLAQPMVALDPNKRSNHYEILVRLVDDHGELVVPEKFLSAAKRYQLLPQLDQVVVERALAELAPFVPVLEACHTVVWINLGGPSIDEPDFADWLRTAIKASGVPGRLLGFEITEGAAIENLEAAKRFISRLNDLGCHMALDDFGTGFCSLAYLKSLSVSALKIDGAFVRDLLTDVRSVALVAAVLEIARQLGLETVAECVEDAAVAARLTELGVSYGQGFHFAPLRPLEEVLHGLTPLPMPRSQRVAVSA